MITRIEIDGFKSFREFALDVPPLLALVGPNSSGKSNLLDALRLVAVGGWDADADEDAVGALRGGPLEQFHKVTRGESITDISIVANAITPTEFGLLPARPCGFGHLAEGEAVFRSFLDLQSTLRDPEPLAHTPPSIVDRLRTGQRSYEDFINGLTSSSGPEIIDRIFSGIRAERQTWRWHEPDPAAMRLGGYAGDGGPLSRRGGNLAAVLGRFAERGVLDDLVVDLAALIPDLAGLEPRLDERSSRWSFDVIIDGQGPVPSSLLSDGTLRVIALLTALNDPDHSGVLFVEEIENGLHPGRLAELLRRMQRSITDLSDPSCLDRPLRQVILTTHSPVVVSELYRLCPESLVFLETAVRIDPEPKRMSRVTVAKPVRAEGEPGTYTSPRQVRKYLGTVEQS